MKRDEETLRRWQRHGELVGYTLRLQDRLANLAALADEGHDYDAHAEHPPEDGRIMECPLCAVLAEQEKEQP